MLHDRGQRHRERLRQLAHRNTVPAAEPRQQRPPRRIGERGKGAVEDLVSILNHVVWYNGNEAGVKRGGRSQWGRAPGDAPFKPGLASGEPR
jgi:hypothetical protein